MAANATAVWRVRPSGNNNNGGGYDSGIASAGTDFSQQNAAQVTQSGGTISTATVTLTDTGASFTSALIGNGIRVAGTGITTTYTFITAVPSGTTLTLQTSPGTTGTSVTYSIGGGWADPFTNVTTAKAALAPGNIVYILGSGTPNPASYTYDYTGNSSSLTNGTSSGLITLANDPNTPGYKAPPDTTGGMPTVRMTVSSPIYASCSWNVFKGIWFVNGIQGNNGMAYGTKTLLFGCVYDQFGLDTPFIGNVNSTSMSVVGCEAFSSVSAGGATSYLIPGGSASNFIIDSCNFHDSLFGAIQLSQFGLAVRNTIIAKCGGDGINLPNQDSGVAQVVVTNCTIDGNSGNGITLSGALIIPGAAIFNNIISNHTGVGKFGISAATGSAATNEVARGLIDYNVFYNNTTDLNNLNYGPHDTTGISDPYVAQSTENYTLK